jgi:hypothetical protein
MKNNRSKKDGLYSILLLALITSTLVWSRPELVIFLLDQLHRVIGPTALPLIGLKILTIHEYAARHKQEDKALALKVSEHTAGLCPIMGTLGTILSFYLSRNSQFDASLVAHAMTSTLFGLSFFFIFMFIARKELAELNHKES